MSLVLVNCPEGGIPIIELRAHHGQQVEEVSSKLSGKLVDLALIW
jgi:hypothetical protein